MKLVEYVPDYILRNYVKVGQTVTILKGAAVLITVPYQPGLVEGYEMGIDLPVEVVNFLPGYTDTYATEDGVHLIHNHQVVWVEKGEYHSTDINNVKEVRES